MVRTKKLELACWVIGKFFSRLLNVWECQFLSAGIDAAQNLVNGIWNTICELPGKMISIGGDLVRGLCNGRVAAQANSRIKLTVNKKAKCPRLSLKSKIEAKELFRNCFTLKIV